MDPLYERTLRALAAALRTLDPIRFRVWAELGLTLPQARVIFILSEEGDRPAGELAERLAVSPPTMTGIAGRLVRQGLIERSDDPDDRRVVRLALTEQGRRLTAEHSESARTHVSRIFETMTPERLEALAAGVEEFAAAYELVRRPEEVAP